MKVVSLFLIILLGIPFKSAANESFYPSFFKDYLDFRASDYPTRRMEALRISDDLPKDEKEIIRNQVVENDLSFMSTTTRFQDLWKLRYRGCWGSDIIVAIADTARFYVQHFDQNLHVTFSQEIGILDKILSELRNTDGIEVKIAYSKLVLALIKLKQKRFMVNYHIDYEESQKIYRQAVKTQQKSSNEEH